MPYSTTLPAPRHHGHPEMNSRDIAARSSLAYPGWSCLNKWAFENSDVCIGNEKTFKFFEDILDEVMAIFLKVHPHRW